METIIINIDDSKNLVKTPLHNFIHYLDKNSNFKYLILEKNGTSIKTLDNYLKKNNVKNIIFFCEAIFYFDIKFLEKLHKKYNIIQYHSDVEEKFEQFYVYISQFADLILVAEKNEVLRYLPYNFNIINFSISFDIKTEKNNEDKTIDLLFIGNLNRPNRTNLINYLKKNNLDIHVYGIGSKNGPISEQEMYKLYKKSKITLNLTNTSLVKLFFQKKLTIRNLLKQGKGRYLEAMINECLVISNYAYDLEEAFKEKLIVRADDFEEIYEKIKYYLSNNSERKKIINNAKKFIINNYSHEMNMNKLLKEIKKIKKKNHDKVYLDNIFFSFIFRFLVDQLLRNLFVNFKWSLYCLKRIVMNFKIINILDIPLLLKYYIFK